MVLGIVFLAILLLDQVSKAVAFAIVGYPTLEPVTVIPGFLEFRCERNTGASYGLLADWDFAQPFLIIVTCVALIVMLIVLVKLQKSKRFLRGSLAVIMAGAAGNLVDRIVQSSVRDFIKLSVNGVGFLNFNCNVADIAVTVGAVMLILALLFVDRDSLVRSLMHKKKEKEEVLAAAAELDTAAAETDNDLGAVQGDTGIQKSDIAAADAAAGEKENGGGGG